MSTVGIIVNPAAGKDIRRLVSDAAPVSDMAKIGMVRRAIVGAAEGGAERIVLSDDPHGLARRAVDGLDGVPTRIEILEGPATGSRLDTRHAAEALWKAEAGAVVILGGDGTHRDVAIGWLDAPIVAVSTGTNNVFPRLLETTVAGLAAGLVAAGHVPLAAVAQRAKTLRVRLSDTTAAHDRGGSGISGGSGGSDTLALVDVALVEGAFEGARAVWDPARLLAVVACIAEVDAVGLSAIAAACHPVDRHGPGAVLVSMGPGRIRRCAIAPGRFATVEIAAVTPVPDGGSVTLTGPGVLAFDGEREQRLGPGHSATVTVNRDGPSVIDVGAAIRFAATHGRGA